MNKICTSIEQSKKLLELGIDINTADMYYEEVCNLPKAIIGNYILHNQCMEDKDYKKLSNPVLSPAWSLTALLSVLDFPSLTQNKEDEWEVCVPNHKSDGYIDVSADNPVDACVEMILKLRRLNLS